MPDVSIINRSTTVGNAVIAAMLPALQTQVTRDFAPFWGAGAVLHFVGSGEKPDPAHWLLYILDNSDQAGDLGYHEMDGVPTGKVFAADDAQNGITLSVTISHELLEMLADPYANRTINIAGVSQILEVCDPVESDIDGYEIAGVLVSNFVTPAWFGMASPGEPGRYDFRGLLGAPCPILPPGGYRMFFANNTWQSTMARHRDGRLGYRALCAGGRSARRAGKPLG